MSDKTPAQFRKTKTGKWAVMAPVEDLEKALAGDGKVEVLKKSGDWSSFVVASLGRPFDVEGTPMCYGYGPGDESEGSGGSGQSGPTQPAQNRPPQNQGDAPSNRGPKLRSQQAPTYDNSEPIPEYQGGPEDEWSGF